jgi:hypothetical protein
MTDQNDPFIGILMLDTRFPRPLGDAGNPESFAIPARVEVVAGAGSLDIVRNGRPAPELVEAFISRAQELQQQGAVAITSTCGFLATIQTEMQQALAVPVMLSALCLYGEIRQRHPLGRIGILTASAASLGSEVLAAVGIDSDRIVISGMEDCPAFADAILRAKSEQLETLDQAAIEADIIHKATRMLSANPDIAAFLLECGNLPPYQQALIEATGKPVYSILDGVNDLVRTRQNGLA